MYSVPEQSPRPEADAPSPAAATGSLTYEPFYGLREKAFSLSADPRFLFRSPAHGTAFDELHSGIRRREGLIVLTGEIGTGKTTLCRSVLQHLDRRTFAAFVADPFVSREDLLKTLLVQFGVISIGDLARGRFNGASRSDLSYPLYEFLDSLVPLQAFAVVVIDEAQNLSLALLEEIRILSELERREKLLQVVLVGQPELRANLMRPEMRQADQRVSVRCELSSLDAAAVAGYVRHRLGIAGRGESRVEFTAPALAAIHQGSSGVPRLINRICDRALQRAFASRAMEVDADCVWRAVADLGLRHAIEPKADQPPAVFVADASSSVPATPVSATLVSATPVSATPVAATPVLATPVSAPPLAATPVSATPVSAAPVPATPVSATPVPAAAVAVAAPVAETPAPERALPELAQFEAEDNLPRSVEQPIDQRRPGSRWMTGVAVSVLVASASIGIPAWYGAGQSLVVHELAGMLPATPAGAPSRPLVPVPPSVDPYALPVMRIDGAQPALPSPPEARAAAPKLPRGYAIIVASFQNRERADRLVDELVNAGYGAHAVERSGGPSGRLIQVQISGYTSALDVQRDVQRIRELPGGYGDAQVVEQP